MLPDVEHSRPRGQWLTTAFLVVVAAAFYTLLRRYTAHGSDVFFLMEWMDEGRVHPNHPLYLLGARGMRTLLSPLTADPMTVLAAFSAFGAAVAVGGMHRAALRLRTPTFAFWLAATVLCTPCLMFFATIGEMHAPFAAAMALCWWGWTVWCERGRFTAALRCGVLTALATLMHATGQLLVPILAVGFLWLCRTMPTRRRLGNVGLFAVAHAAVFAIGFAWLQSRSLLHDEEPAGFLLQRAASGTWLGYLPQALWSQWVIAFAPLSLLALLAFVRGRAAVGLGLHLAVLGYIAVSAMLAPAANEVGAYCLPLLLPVAVVVFDCVPRRFWWLLCVGAAIATGLHRTLHPVLAPDFALGAAIHASKGDPARVWLVGDEAESWGARWRAGRPELIEAWITLVELEQRSGGNAAAVTVEQLSFWLTATAQHVLGAGKELVVTEHAVQVLSQRLPSFAVAWQSFIAAHDVEALFGEGGWFGYLVKG